MDTIIGLIVFVFGVLQIILFFKIWGMTNDVRKMTQHTEDILHVCRTINSYTRGNGNTTSSVDTSIDASNKIDAVDESNATGFTIGDLVVDKNENQWRVIEINAPIIKCKSSTKGIVEFDMGELRLF